MKRWKLKKFLWLGIVLVVLLGAVTGYFWVEMRLPISIRGGVLNYPEAKLTIAVPELLRWRLEDQKFAAESGLVAFWRHTDQAGSIYLNLIEKNAENGLTFERLRENTYGKLVLMKFKPIAKNELLNIQFFANDAKRVRAIYLRELPSGFLLSSYVDGDHQRFEVYRKDWEKILSSIEIQ